MSKQKIIILSLFVLISSSAIADVTYTFHLSGVDQSISNQIMASVNEAVPIYNKYGSFNKNLNIYYSSGVPTAQANYDGVITFGGSRNTRVALHEMGHTVGVGTYYQYGNLMVSGLWQGFYGKKLALEMDSPYSNGLHGDSVHIWPWGLNYDSEDTSFMERIKHVRIMAALRCDMGIMAYAKEAEHQIVPLGGTAVFGVASPIATSYQWYKNGSPLSDGGDISGATRSTLQIANVDASDAGNYYCRAVGASETLNSRTRRLIIIDQVAQWDFNGNANDSIGSYNGTTSGSPGYTTGKISQAIDLDGTDDYVTLPDGVADAEDMTVAAWVYWDGGSQWQRIFDFGASTANYMYLTPRSGSNTMRFAIKDNYLDQQINTTQLTSGQWVHLAVTLRNDAATLYVNGQPAASNGNTTNNPVDLLADKNYIGESQFSSDPLFNGRIDDFRIYNYALAGSQIWNLWGQSANNPPVFTADPLVFPDGDEGVAYTGQTLAGYASDPDSDPITFSKVSGPGWLSVAGNGALSGTPTTAYRGQNTFVVRVTDTYGATDDVTLNITVYALPDTYYEFENNTNDSIAANHGTPTGSPVYTTGVLNQAIDLDGSDDYITLPSGIADTEDITITAWINWDGGSNWQRIFDFGNNTDEYLILSPNGSTNKLTFAITGSGGAEKKQVLETTGLTIGQWTHVAITISGNTGKLYVNGILKDINAAMTINPSDFDPTVNYIGKSQWATDPLFNGQIDDFRIFTYALTQDEITAVVSGQDFMPPDIPVNFSIDFGDGTIDLDWDDNTETDFNSYNVYRSTSQGGPYTKIGSALTNSDYNDSNFADDTKYYYNVTSVDNSDNESQPCDDILIFHIAGDLSFDGYVDTFDLDELSAGWPTTYDLYNFAHLGKDWLSETYLVAHLPLDSDANDITWNQLQGVTDGNVGWTGSGYIDGAVELYGPGDSGYITLSGFKGITGTGSRTCCAWIKTNVNLSHILTWGSSGTGSKWIIQTDVIGRLQLDVGGGTVVSTTSIMDNQWHHIAVVLNSDGTPNLNEVELYIDGLPDTGFASDVPIDTVAGTDVSIGAYPSDPLYFDGLIDDVRIYNRALSAEEIGFFAK